MVWIVVPVTIILDTPEKYKESIDDYQFIFESPEKYKESNKEYQLILGTPENMKDQTMIIILTKIINLSSTRLKNIKNQTNIINLSWTPL